MSPRSSAVRPEGRPAPSRPRRNLVSVAVKRMVDVAAAAVGLTVLSPVFLVVAVAVATRLGRPVLFRQRRVGCNGEEFDIVKFRTMTDERDVHGELLPDADRLPRLGVQLRRWSLDELPELAQVVSGKLSLVGPRPFMAEYREVYSDDQWQRHGVRPGITGLAQISGRNSLSWEDRIDIDLEYIRTWSLRLDLRILFLTVVRTLGGSGVNQDGEATMERWDHAMADGGVNDR